ncbi:MAG: RDD family protein [Alphaproteobacteria bacterium]|jgi:uncharacterized RDD family membrane protein YckC|nr:RDD family protein [Alphaproteobacteria bacterium]
MSRYDDASEWRDEPDDGEVAWHLDDEALSAPEYYDGIRLKRIFAYLIDVLIVTVLVLAWWLVGTILSILTLFASWPLVVLGAVLLPIAYHSCFISAERNATPGMRAMGVRVAVWHGGNPGFPQALLQTVLFYATVPTTQGLVLLVSFFNDRGRCLHDILCGTVVVNVIESPLLSDSSSDY